MNTLSPDIFKANDIRGIYGDTLTDEVAYQIGQALAAQAQKNSAMALGRDGRLSSPSLAAACADGLRAGGMAVLDVGLVPTPALYFAATQYAAGNGVMITGSHNPKNYNGMKMLLAGRTIGGDDVQALFRRIRDNHFPVATDGNLQSISIQSDYIAAVKQANPIKRPLSIIIDAGNGATGDYAPALFQAIGCAVDPLFCEIDGHFPNHHPDPAQPDNLRDAANRLAQTGADMAFIFDGDGDRLGVLLPDTPPFFADRLLMLYASDLLSRHPGARIVYDVKCSSLLAPWIEQHGGIADMQPTGHAFIKARMKASHALLGGEMSGHFYFQENWFGFDDALFAGARLAAILSEDKQALTAIPESVASPEWYVDMTGRNQHDFMVALRAQARFPQAKRLVTIDGLRVEYEGGFGLVRASNTTPALVLRFEAENEAMLTHIQHDFQRVLMAADKSLLLPFLQIS